MMRAEKLDAAKLNGLLNANMLMHSLIYYSAPSIATSLLLPMKR